MRKTPRTVRAPRPPTRLEALTTSVAEDWAGQNSATIHSKMRVLQFEGQEADKSIVALQSTITNLKERRAVIVATLNGLATVIAKR